MFNKAIHYTRALSRWIKAGRPVRSEMEIIHLMDTFCKLCKDYNSPAGTCNHCGCHVNVSTIAPLNKIAMETEHCPLGKW